MRARKTLQLQQALALPGMFATDGSALQTVAVSLLSDLCFIDERDADEVETDDALRRFGKLGVAGAFQAVFGDDCRFVEEVASVLAERASQLGYLELNASAPAADLDIDRITAAYAGQDARLSDVVTAVGTPPFTVGKRVLCYPTTGRDWVFFDFFEESTSRYDADGGVFRSEQARDPLLRNVRVPAATFDASLILTRYGKVLRWGPGWWLRSDASESGRASDGVAEQLREIEVSDPSQSLGLRRP